jgi:hypothetical protein
MGAKVDVSQVHALTRLARRELYKIPDIMLEVVRDRAALERRTHVFRNITGKLEANTLGIQTSRDTDPATASLIMERDYASFVRDRGRTDIDKRADEAERMIERKFVAMAEKLGKR